MRKGKVRKAGRGDLWIPSLITTRVGLNEVLFVTPVETKVTKVVVFSDHDDVGEVTFRLEGGAEEHVYGPFKLEEKLLTWSCDVLLAPSTIVKVETDLPSEVNVSALVWVR